MNIFLLPCYNEENSIKDVLEKIKKKFPSSKIIVVDDGSTDRTFQISKDTINNLNIDGIILRHRKNMGLGKALSTGINYVIKNFEEGNLVILDADSSHPVELTKKMLQELEKGNIDVVIASRYRTGGKQINLSFVRNILSRIFSFFFHFLFPNITDFSSGYRAYSVKFLRENFKRIELDKGFASSFELLFLLLKKKAKVKEVPLILDYSKKKSRSKFNFKKVLFSYLRVLSKIL
ncbi:MAG: hypothetical protein DRI36_05425 [Caldiserica bacterium]|nr:MAG: hypothetical protein DRI36_05425 [Caldisericota bacterium]